MPDLADITWRLYAYAGHWLPDDDLTAFTDWMAANRLDPATAELSVLVDGGVITYGQDRSGPEVRSPHREIATVTVPLRTPPPDVYQPTCGPDALAALHAVLARHEWSSGFDGVCVDCSDTTTGLDGRIWCHRDAAAPWPCPSVRAALTEAGMPVPTSGHRPIRVLGDCLDSDDNAKVFA